MIQIPPTSKRTATIELTSLVDIIFIVMVFLLLTANSRLLFLPVEIPHSDSILDSASTQAKTVISLRDDNPQWAINEQVFETWPLFKVALLKHINAHDHSVVVAPDRGADVEPLVQLLALLNKHDVTNTQILMEPMP